jgi:aquaporin Z
MQTEAAEDWRVRSRMYFSELAGTAILVLGGLSVVIFMFGDGSPIVRTLANEQVRMAVTAFLFGTVGLAVALSRIGSESGAHINPAVTLAFWLMHKLDARTASGYVIAQMLGAAVGALPLLAWDSMGRSVAFGATLPGKDYSTSVAVMGEAVTTFALVASCAFSSGSATCDNILRS